MTTPLTDAMRLQVLLSQLSPNPVLETAQELGVKLIGAEGTLIALCPDGSVLLATITDDPDDPERELWNTASFGNLSDFTAFLRGKMPEIDDILGPIDSTLREDLTAAANKFLLARSLEPGHA